MGSRKPSAKRKQVSEFKSQLGGLDDLFTREERREEQIQEERESARMYKACESKNRYSSYSEAAATKADCEAHGSPTLHIYRCPYCNGWHLTSKQPE